MKNLTTIIEGRSRMIDSLIEQGIREYGENSATVNSKNFRVNIGIQVSYILKPVIKSLMIQINKNK
jgi:hypothetical protein